MHIIKLCNYLLKQTIISNITLVHENLVRLQYSCLMMINFKWLKTMKNLNNHLSSIFQDSKAAFCSSMWSRNTTPTKSDR